MTGLDPQTLKATLSILANADNIIYLLEDELHARLELVLRVDLKLVELLDEGFELLRTQLVKDGADLAKEHVDGVLQASENKLRALYIC